MVRPSNPDPYPNPDPDPDPDPNPNPNQDAQFEMHTLLHTLGGHLASQYVPTLLAALQWVHMLLRKSGPRVMQLSQQIWPALFTCLSNASEEVHTK